MKKLKKKSCFYFDVNLIFIKLILDVCKQIYYNTNELILKID